MIIAIKDMSHHFFIYVNGWIDTHCGSWVCSSLSIDIIGFKKYMTSCSSSTQEEARLSENLNV